MVTSQFPGYVAINRLSISGTDRNCARMRGAIQIHNLPIKSLVKSKGPACITANLPESRETIGSASTWRNHVYWPMSKASLEVLQRNVVRDKPAQWLSLTGLESSSFDHCFRFSIWYCSSKRISLSLSLSVSLSVSVSTVCLSVCLSLFHAYMYKWCL